MSYEEELLAKLSKITRINISDAEKSNYIKKLVALMEFSKLINANEVDAEPMFTVQEWLGKHMENLRKDEAIEGNNTNSLINTAPDKEDVFIAVPKVIE
ncbi:Asp-tRNA(Asn)/Glu-tRNA(Gln) amidotransferase subunit GatC [Rickettsiales bacterium LUAb2]